MSDRAAALPVPFTLADSPLAGTTLIEASAGTGKTAALSSLFVRLVAERALFVDKILVVTFTEAATAELRERIRELLRWALGFVSGDQTVSPDRRELASVLERARGSVGVVERLRDAVRSFDEAEISTIHGFCRSVLAENAFESGAGFRMELVADEAEIEQEVTDDFWRSRVSVAPVSWVRLRMPASRLRAGPAGLLALLAARSLDPKQRVVPDGAVPGIAPLEDALRAAFVAARSAWHGDGAEARRLIRDFEGWHNGWFKPEKREGLIRTAEALFLGEDPWDGALLAQLGALAASSLAGKLKKGFGLPASAVFDACERLAAAFDTLAAALEQYDHALEREYLEYAPRELASRKRRRGVWSFDDLLAETYRALTGPTGDALVARLRGRYGAALIDEFQDTDPLQCHIFLRAFSGVETALYLIGDPKQAIYGFRGADVYAYLGAAKAASRRLALATNRRSTPVLVRAVNALFEGHAHPFVHPEIAFTPCGYEADREPGEVTSELVFELCEGSEQLGKGDARRIFAEAAARRVTHAIAAGARPKRIAVLVRTNLQAGMVQKALRAAGVPGVLYSAGSVFASDEALEIGLILSSLARPGSERALRASLATRIRGVGAAELEAMPAEEIDRRLDRMHAFADTWRDKGVMRALRALLDDEGCRPRLLGLLGGERRLTNVLHLLELLHQAEGELHLGPDELLAWLRERHILGGEGKAGELRLETDDDAVTISTIHHAKGLQYDVVLCPFLWDGVSLRKGEPVTFHDERGIPVLDLAESADGAARSLEEQVAEGMRLLYVALTRARLACYVSWGWVSGSETSPLFFLLHSRGVDASAPASRGRLAGILEQAFKAMTADRLRQEVEALRDAAGRAFAVRAMEQGVPPVRRSGGSEAVADARTSGRASWKLWSVTSYSGLTRGRHQEAPERDRGAVEPPEAPAEGADIHGFPRGAAAGTFIHRIFEDLDFAAAGGGEHEASLAARCRESGYDAVWAPVLAAMTRSVARTELPAGGSAVRLADVPAEDRISELEFHLPLSRVTPALLSGAFGRAPGAPSALAPALAGLGFGQVEGFLQGFIDLVFRAGGRYFIADWKSNHLGAEADDYAPDAMAVAMRENLYELQLTLYTVALDRYLAWRLPGYDYDRHFGGVFYLFVRGVRAERPGLGIHATRPPGSLVRDLVAAFAGDSDG